MPRAAYLEREAELRSYLTRKIGVEAFRIPRYYGNKADFGDMDIVVNAKAASGSTWESLRAQIVGDLGIEQTQSAGPLYSTVYRGLQVDFFLREDSEFLSTASYLSFNDAGNLIGKICRRMGLKYGEDGLSWVYRRANDGHYRRDLLVSKDFEKIYGYLDLDYQRWQQGFDSLEDIFEWVMASRYFSVEPYLEPGKRIRERTKVRPTIKRFLEYLEEHSIAKRYVYEEHSTYLVQVDQFFPEAQLLAQVQAEDDKAVRDQQLKERFSGKRVMNLLPLRGQALGAFIREFHKHYSDDEILAMDASKIDDTIRQLHELLSR